MTYEQLFDSFAARGVSSAEYAMLRPYREFPNPETCLKIQCGTVTQDEAGFDLLADCAAAGYSGSMSCADPLCAPHCGETAYNVARASFPLPVSPRVDLMFLAGPVPGCAPIYPGAKFSGPYSDAAPCGCGARGFINEYPVLSLALVAAAAYGVWRWRSR